MIKKYLTLFVIALGFIFQSCNVQKYDSSLHVRKTRNSNKPETIQQTPVLHEYADPTNDWCFKHIFGEVLSESGNANDFTRDLLNSLLELSGEEEILELHFCDPNVNPAQREEHAFITDVHCIDKKGYKFIIEMQVATHQGWEERMQAYVARDYGKQLPRGSRYTNILPVHLVAITNFNMFPARVDFLSHHRITEGKTKECFFKGMQWTVLELLKFNKTTSEVIEGKDRWAFLLKNAESISSMPDDEQRLIFSNPIIRDAYVRIDKANWTNEEREIYESIEGKRKLTVAVLRTKFEEGIEEGRELERQKFEEERELERQRVEEERELERQRVEEKNRNKAIKLISKLLNQGHDDSSIKEMINSDEEYADSDLDNMINYAKEEIQRPADKKIRHG